MIKKEQKKNDILPDVKMTLVTNFHIIKLLLYTFVINLYILFMAILAVQ
jgi:hypothetical protein